MSAVCLIVGEKTANNLAPRFSQKKLINSQTADQWQIFQVFFNSANSGGAWEVLHQNHLPWRATLHQVNITRFYNHFMNPNRLVLVGTFTEEYVMFSQWSFSFRKSGSFPETKISYFQLLWSILKAILSEGCQSEFPTLTFLLQILHLL